MTQEVLISAIKIGDRFRQEYKDIPKLAKSIQDLGLIHPIVLDANYNLVAGGRRIRAYNYLNREAIPVDFLAELSPLQRRRMELEENIQRSDMEWHEIEALRAEIHRLMELEHGTPAEFKSSSLGWNQQNTADMLGISKVTISESLSMAKLLEEMPELKNFPSRLDAKRFLKQINNMATIQEAFELGELVIPESSYDWTGSYQISDVFDGLRSLNEHEPRLKIAEVDPPYAVNLTALREDEYISYTEINSEDYPEFLSKLAPEVYRVLASDAWCIWWFPFIHYNVVFSSLASAGFKLDPIPGIWHKTSSNITSGKPDRLLARGYEQFFIARKGKPVLRGAGKSNVFSCESVPQTERVHVAERPVPLIKAILEAFAQTGSTVLCPFLGSGNTIFAAYEAGMSCIGWDVLEDMRLNYLKKVAEIYK